MLLNLPHWAFNWKRRTAESGLRHNLCWVIIIQKGDEERLTKGSFHHREPRRVKSRGTAVIVGSPQGRE